LHYRRNTIYERWLQFLCSVVLPRKSCFNSQATVWFSKCLQLSVSVSLETVFRHQLVSKKQSVRGNVFAHSFPRNGPNVTILLADSYSYRISGACNKWCCYHFQLRDSENAMFILWIVRNWKLQSWINSVWKMFIPNFKKHCQLNLTVLNRRTSWHGYHKHVISLKKICPCV
jgi:hypothetical protein